MLDRSTARTFIYNMLSLCYLYPDEKVYPSIAGGEWITELTEALYLLEERIFDDCLKAIEKSISGLREGEQLAMAHEYERLFINAFPHPIAPPCGFLYLEKEGVVSAKMTSEVQRFYHHAGFPLKEDLRDLPDHIAHELEFMAILAGKESQATGKEKIKLEEIQMDFLSRFILPWVPTFCERVVEHSRHPFYHHLGNLTREFIKFEKNYLGVPEEPNFWKTNP